ncbi:MAG: hypothetical protein EBZ44_00810 [Verrucomicrobia bacterium]|nr:hypothetical protein [Verrucomicrobiota bacterium]
MSLGPATKQERIPASRPTFWRFGSRQENLPVAVPSGSNSAWILPSFPIASRYVVIICARFSAARLLSTSSAAASPVITSDTSSVDFSFRPRFSRASLTCFGLRGLRSAPSTSWTFFSASARFFSAVRANASSFVSSTRIPLSRMPATTGASWHSSCHTFSKPASRSSRAQSRFSSEAGSNSSLAFPRPASKSRRANICS